MKKKKKKSKRSMDSGWKTGGGLQMQTFDDVTTIGAEVLSDFEVSNGRSASLRKLEQETRPQASFAVPAGPPLTGQGQLDRGGGGGGSFATMLSSMSEDKLDLETGGDAVSGGSARVGGGGSFATMLTSMSEHKLDLEGKKQTIHNPMSGPPNCATNPLHQAVQKQDENDGAAQQPANMDPRELSAVELMSWLMSVNIPENAVQLLEPHDLDGKFTGFASRACVTCFVHPRQVPFCVLSWKAVRL
jgi:hypothetical protein